MELAFEKNAVDHLQSWSARWWKSRRPRKRLCRTSLLDVGRIVGCWGVPVVHKQEWRQNGMGVSGGVAPGSCMYRRRGAPRQVAVYLPSPQSEEFPPTEQEGQMQVSCRIKSIDARMVNSRKDSGPCLSDLQGEAYGPGQAVFTPCRPAQELEVLRRRLPCSCPRS